MIATYFDAAQRAIWVSKHLLGSLNSARQIYVGGLRASGGDAYLGESQFLCKLFPDLIFVDDWRSGQFAFGRKVISTNELSKVATNNDVLINNCQSTGAFNHFARQADSLGIPTCTTLEAMSVCYANGQKISFNGLTAVYGPSFFIHTLQNIEIYEKYRSIFYDQLSKNTYDDLIKYRLSGNPKFLQRVAVGHNYGPAQHDSYMLNTQFFNFNDDEVLIDAGALTGDSTEYFIRSALGKFERVILFEPSDDSADQCEIRLRNLNKEFVGRNILGKCEVVRKGLYSFTGELSFNLTLYNDEITTESGLMPQSAHIVDTGLSSSFVEKGSEYKIVKVPVTTLDEFLQGQKATFIKFEIEGSEVDALNGAIDTIKKYKPKLALSIYHRPQDLELILQYVLDLNLGYKIALRAHNPNCPDAIVLYCW